MEPYTASGPGNNQGHIFLAGFEIEPTNLDPYYSVRNLFPAPRQPNVAAPGGELTASWRISRDAEYVLLGGLDWNQYYKYSVYLGTSPNDLKLVAEGEMTDRHSTR